MTRTSPRRIFRRPIRGVRVHVSRYGDGADEAERRRGHAENETQKPEGIVRPLVRYFCPEGGRLFVPFVGSGTDLIIARELGIRAIGFETREKQCEIAAKRLSQGVLNFGGAA